MDKMKIFGALIIGGLIVMLVFSILRYNKEKKLKAEDPTLSDEQLYKLTKNYSNSFGIGGLAFLIGWIGAWTVK